MTRPTLDNFESALLDRAPHPRDGTGRSWSRPATDRPPDRGLGRSRGRSGRSRHRRRGPSPGRLPSLSSVRPVVTS